MRKRVLFVLDGTYPMDVRVHKELIALRNYVDVYLVCAKNSKNTSDYLENYFLGPSTSKLSKGIREVLISLVGIDPIMFRTLKSIKRSEEFDAIHVHDLPQFKTVYKVFKKSGVPIILDLHENFPEALNTWFLWRRSKFIRLKNRLIFSFDRWKEREKFAVENADHVIAVVQEMKKKLVKEFEVEDSKITVVTNSESRDFFENIEECELPFEDDAFNILYTGGIGPHRGLDDVILALGALRKEGEDNTLLHVFGSGHIDNINYLKELTIIHEVDHKVFFHSTVPLRSVPFLMMNADLNIIPHKSNGHCDQTVPHKLFHGLLSQKPLLVSSSAPLLRITEYGKYAAFFEAGNFRSCSRSLKSIINDIDKYSQKAEIAKNHFSEEKRTWNNEATKLKSLYSSLS